MGPMEPRYVDTYNKAFSQQCVDGMLGLAMLKNATPLLTQTADTKMIYIYGALDRLTLATDPSDLNTTYQCDSLSDPASLTSPDAGVTCSHGGLGLRGRRFVWALLSSLMMSFFWTACPAQTYGWKYQSGINGSQLYATAFDACQAAYDAANASSGNSGSFLRLFPPITMVAETPYYDRCYAPYGNPPPGTRSNFYYNFVFADQSSVYSYDPFKNVGGGDSCGCDEGYDGGDGDGDGGSTAANATVMAGDPINVSTGNAYRQDTDFSVGAWLTFRRFYNSVGGIAFGVIGTQWRHSFDRSLELIDSPLTVIHLLRPDGRQYAFHKANGVWVGDPDVPDTLIEQDDAGGIPIGFKVWIAELRHTEIYDANGVLQSVVDLKGQGIALTYSTNYNAAPRIGVLLTVTDTQGRRIAFAYNNSGYVSKVTLPDGGTLSYAYDSNGNLTSVTYPDGKVKTYVYNEPGLTGGASFPNALTGIVDESGTRYESTSYIGSGTYAGYASASSRAGNVDATQITYNSNGSSMVRYPLGLSATLGIATVQGVNKVASVSTYCGASCNQPYSARTYDANGYPATVTDWKNTVTRTTYDANGLLDQQIDASGTVNQRTTNTTWNTMLRVPLTRVVLDAGGSTVSSTQWVYNSAGQTMARCEIDPTNSAASGYACSASGTVPAGVRRWTYTYCTAVDGTQCPLVGLLLTATGPRTDVAQTTSYSYYLDSASSGCPTPGGACHQPGDLHTVTDPAGHVTTIASYDADGRVTRETDANGIDTDLTYTPRGWLASRTVGGAQTTFGYTPYGAVSSVTDPDGVTTRYDYDAAHRLTKVTDAQGNYVQYTLDAAGNKTAEQVADANGTVHQSLSRTFNALGELTTVVDGLNHTVFNASAAGSYDANGNLMQSSDGLGIQRRSGYDALNRLVQTIDNYNGTN